MMNMMLIENKGLFEMNRMLMQGADNSMTKTIKFSLMQSRSQWDFLHYDSNFLKFLKIAKKIWEIFQTGRI